MTQRQYALNDETAKKLYDAARVADDMFPADFEVAAETLAAQNAELR